MEFEKLKPGMFFSLKEGSHRRIFAIERKTKKDIIFKGYAYDGPTSPYMFPWDKSAYSNYKGLLKRLTSDESKEFIRVIFDKSRPRRDWA
jgi:hypothetical protein